MDFISTEFIILCLCSICAFNCIKSCALKKIFLAFANLVFIVSFSTNPFDFTPLVIFIAAGYISVKFSVNSKKIWFCFLLILFVFIFMYFKQYTLMSYFSHANAPYLFIGASYILFRTIHIQIDVHQKMMPPPSFWEYFCYVTFFLSFVSGPIQRFPEFISQLTQPCLPVTCDSINRGVARLAWGLFLTVVASPITFKCVSKFKEKMVYKLSSNTYDDMLAVYFAGEIVSQAANFYINFCGYMGIVIGIGLLCGFHLPENFNKPYLAKNFLDFWSRWHITLSQWFKYYIFNSIMLVIARRVHQHYLPYVVVVAFFTTFLLMGIWHGSSSNYIVYGFVLGFGVATNKLYQIVFVASVGKKKYKQLCAEQWYQVSSSSLALTFFSIGLICIWFPYDALSHAQSAKFLLRFFEACCFVFIAGTFFCFFAKKIDERVSKYTFFQNKHIPYYAFAICAGVYFFIMSVIILVNNNPIPEFVYKAY